MGTTALNPDMRKGGKGAMNLTWPFLSWQAKATSVEPTEEGVIAEGAACERAILREGRNTRTDGLVSMGGRAKYVGKAVFNAAADLYFPPTLNESVYPFEL